jgi:CelD/BcsL family acetyltransferase involved in cellulose biosynthesis
MGTGERLISMTSALAAPAITTRVISSFDEFAPRAWRSLLAKGATDEIFLTFAWQSAWWKTFGRGQLLLIIAERDGEAIAMAPLFADCGMVFFVGSGGSDYLDFVGDISEPDVLDELLSTAIQHVRDFVGFRFYHVPDSSPTGDLLRAAALRLGWSCYDESEIAAPQMTMRVAATAADKKSLVRHERAFEREGDLRIEHLSDAEAISPHLDDFFRQHIDRWEVTAYPSLFIDERQKEFYRRLTEAASEAGWLRFARVLWNQRPIAYHFGFNYDGKFLWYKPTFAIDLAKKSPGEVLLRNLLLQAMAEDCDTFDFGLGDEAFKHRFATQVNYVRTWGLYPSAKEIG